MPPKSSEEQALKRKQDSGRLTGDKHSKHGLEGEKKLRRVSKMTTRLSVEGEKSQRKMNGGRNVSRPHSMRKSLGQLSESHGPDALAELLGQVMAGKQAGGSYREGTSKKRGHKTTYA